MGGKGGKRDRDPCIDRCEFSGPKGWCLGCGRTRQETQDWKGLKPYGKNAILRALPKRMARIRSEQVEPPAEEA